MKKRELSVSNQEVEEEVVDKLDVIIKLLGVIATVKDFASLTQGDQIVHMNKIGLRNKDIASILGIKHQQVTNALRNIGKKKKG